MLELADIIQPPHADYVITQLSFSLYPAKLLETLCIVREQNSPNINEKENILLRQHYSPYQPYHTDNQNKNKNK